MSSKFPKLIGPDDDGIFLLILGDDENRFTRHFLLQFLSHLDTVESHIGPTALVISSDSAKFFSNGLSFEELAADAISFLTLFHRVLLKLCVLGVPTVAAINGHAFAGGAMIAFCCDYRVMNDEKGFICTNEIDIGLPLTPGLAAVVRAKANSSQWVDLMLRAKRFTGHEALRCCLVDAISHPDKVRSDAYEIAKREVSKGEDKVNYRNIKAEAFCEEVSVLKKSAMGAVEGFAERMGFVAKL